MIENSMMLASCVICILTPSQIIFSSAEDPSRLNVPTCGIEELNVLDASRASTMMLATAAVTARMKDCLLRTLCVCMYVCKSQ